MITIKMNEDEARQFVTENEFAILGSKSADGTRRVLVVNKKMLDNYESRGLGDTISKMLSAIGITKDRVKRLFKKCGCDERQAQLNKWFPYKSGKKNDKGVESS